MLAIAAVSLVFLGSCAQPSGTIVAPPSVPGAEFAGAESCEICHEDISAKFVTADHAVLGVTGPAADTLGCESCHGPGSLHIEGGGDPLAIVNPGKSPEACYGCHANVRGDFALPSRHPVATGPLDLTTARMACGDCHNPHEGDAGGFKSLAAFGKNQGCTDCHAAQEGPFVFEHEALRDGCTTCHNSHGSLNAQLLASSNATLCTSCHFQEQPRAGVVMIGGQDHSAFLGQGTCFTSGCHEAVHGSQVSSSLRF